MFIYPPSSPREFWEKPDEYWPREEARLWFGARAFNMVGQALFPDTWAGREGYTNFVRPLPERPAEATPQEKHAASRLIVERFGAPVSSNHLALLGQGTPPQAFPTEDQWEYARAEWERMLEHRQPVMDRKRAVSEWFVGKIFDDHSLRTAVVDKATMAAFEGIPDHWNLKWHQLDYRWTWCAYAPAEPTNAAATPTHDIFFFREDLATLLDQSRVPGAQGTLALAAAEPSATEEGEEIDAATYWRRNRKKIEADGVALIADKGGTILREDFAREMAGRWKISLHRARTDVWRVAIKDYPDLAKPGNRRGRKQTNTAPPIEVK